MGIKKNHIIIAVVLVMVLVIFGYMVSDNPISSQNGDVDSVEEDGEEVEGPEVSLTREPHLFRAGTDGEPGVRNEGEAITDFDQRDLFGVSGRYEATEEVEIFAHLLDEDEEVIEEELFSVTAEGESGFSMCCKEVPQEVGSYYIEITTEDESLELIPFSVE